MKRGAGIDLAVVLHMDPNESTAEADQVVEENQVGLRGQDQRAEQEGHTRDLISVPIAEVAKGPVTEELEADLVIKRDVKAEIKRKQKRKTGSEEKRRTNITPR